jgi:class 3 adenylate cyclase
MEPPTNELFVSQGGLPARITQPEPSPLTRAVSMQAEVSRELVDLRLEMGILAPGLQQVQAMLNDLRQQQVAAQLTAPLGQLREVEVRLARVATMLADLEHALANANATMQTLRMERGQLQALYVIAEHLNTTLERPLLLERVLDDLLIFLRADRGGVLLLDAQKKLRFEAARAANKLSLSNAEYHMSQHAVEQVWQSQRPLIFTDAQHDARLGASASVRVQGINAIMCAPLRVQGIAIGVVYVDQLTAERPFTEQQLDLLAAFCNEAAIAIQNANLFATQMLQTQEIAAMKNYTDSILSSLSSGVLALDNTGRITRANQAAEQLLRLPPEEILGKSFALPLSRLPETAFLSDIQATMHDAEAQQSTLVHGPIAGQGQPLTLSVGWAALCDAERRRLGTVIVLDDLTEFKHAQREAQLFRRYVHPDVVEVVSLPNGTDLGGQTREITVLFADIHGFTKLSEILDPETLVNLLNQYLTIATEAILAHGGTVTMFEGDAVMAIFNAPQALPDHPWQAVQAAWDVWRGVQRHNERTGNRPVQCGIGVHTGLALVGNIGAAGRLQNYTAIGDTVNIAKRLQQYDRENGILLSEETYQRVKDAVQVQRLADIVVKNKSQPLHVLELRGLA